METIRSTIENKSDLKTYILENKKVIIRNDTMHGLNQKLCKENIGLAYRYGPFTYRYIDRNSNIAEVVIDPEIDFFKGMFVEKLSGGGTTNKDKGMVVEAELRKIGFEIEGSSNLTVFAIQGIVKEMEKGNTPDLEEGNKFDL